MRGVTKIMTCYKPLTGYRTPTGQIEFHDKGKGDPIAIPCGRCIGCRIDRSEQWATRCVHEASLHEDNCFITLTYDSESLPPDGSLRKKDFQVFMRELRRFIYPKKVRFYHVGEYGERNNRPHYHALLFGYNFDDWVYLFDSPAGSPIYTSEKLTKIWGKGFTTIGELTFESAAYCARYCLKKINGPQADQINEKTGLKHYERYNDFTGEIHSVVPEYTTMSRRPGIGRDWIDKFKSDVFPKDYTHIRGVSKKPPKYYDRFLQEIDPDMYDDIKAGRVLKAFKSEDNTPQRLQAREKVKEAKHSFKKRSL
jgi:hypothetical protein